MARAGRKDSTEWLGYSRAKKLVGDYQGWDAATTDAEFLKKMESDEIEWRGRLRAPKGYSGPGPGDPKFFKLDDPNQLMPTDGQLGFVMLYSVHINADTATRIDGAAVEHMEVSKDSLVRLRWLPPDDGDASPVKKARAERGPRQITPIHNLARKTFPPDGKPPDDMSTPKAMQRFGEAIKKHNDKVSDDLKIRVSDDTMKRAIARR